jgi:signal transduction histidine kinase
VPVQQAVQGALREQREAIERQRVFLADASHQLRTPFAVLRVQLQGMQSGELAVADTLPKMLATVDRSSLLVRQILSMAKVEQLVAQAEWQPVQLEDVAREVCLECGPLIARKGLDFSFESVPVRLHTDAWMLGELLRNLLSNAIHHAPRGSAIGLVVRVLPGQAEIIVWDNGGGIDASVRDRLFEPFQSASGASGVGLGLSICRQIAQSMQAQVNLYNRVQDDRVVGVDAVVRWPLDSEVLV